LAVSRINDKVEERREEREEKQAVSLQPAWAEELRKSMRETCGLYINCEELTIVHIG
jgi:hypothetical protein